MTCMASPSYVTSPLFVIDMLPSAAKLSHTAELSATPSTNDDSFDHQPIH